MSNKIKFLAASLLCAAPLIACSSSSTSPATGGTTSGDDGGSSTNDSGVVTSGNDSGTGMTGGNCGTAPAGADAIDDMSKSSGSIIAINGRAGAWYTYNDIGVTGADPTTQNPPAMMPFVKKAVTDCGAVKFGAETDGMVGMAKGNWGAGEGFDLNNAGGDAGVAMPYDVSAYTGVTFWANATAAMSVDVHMADSNTQIGAGKCGATTYQCSDDFLSTQMLTPGWAQYSFKFSDLAQVGWSKQMPTPMFDTKAVYSIHFQVGAGAAFNFTIGPVFFTK